MDAHQQLERVKAGQMAIDRAAYEKVELHRRTVEKMDAHEALMRLRIDQMDRDRASYVRPKPTAPIVDKISQGRQSLGMPTNKVTRTIGKNGRVYYHNWGENRNFAKSPLSNARVGNSSTSMDSSFSLHKETLAKYEKDFMPGYSGGHFEASLEAALKAERVKGGASLKVGADAHTALVYADQSLNLVDDYGLLTSKSRAQVRSVFDASATLSLNAGKHGVDVLGSLGGQAVAFQGTVSQSIELDLNLLKLNANVDVDGNLLGVGAQAGAGLALTKSGVRGLFELGLTFGAGARVKANFDISPNWGNINDLYTSPKDWYDNTTVLKPSVDWAQQTVKGIHEYWEAW